MCLRGSGAGKMLHNSCMFLKNAHAVRLDRSGFSKTNYNAMFDVLPLYVKFVSSAEFTLKAPYAGTTRADVRRGSPNSLSGRVAWLRP
jgi:hypothetical protein